MGVSEVGDGCARRAARASGAPSAADMYCYRVQAHSDCPDMASFAEAISGALPAGVESCFPFVQRWCRVEVHLGVVASRDALRLGEMLTIGVALPVSVSSSERAHRRQGTLGR